MNRTFKVVFNKARGALMVAYETTCSVQKKGVKTTIAVAAALAVGAAMAADPVTWTDNFVIGEDVTVAAGESVVVDSAEMTGGTLTVEGNVHRQGADGLFNLNGGAIDLKDSGNFEVRDFTMNENASITVTGNGVDDNGHGRTSPAFGSYNSFAMNGGTVTLSQGGRIWIGSANKNDPDSYQRMELNGGTINLKNGGYITGNKRWIQSGSYYDDTVVVQEDKLAYNVVGLDGATVNVEGSDNVIDAAGVEVTAGSLSLAAGSELTVRATTSTNQADDSSLKNALKTSSYMSVNQAGVVDVDGGRLVVDVKELRVEDGGSLDVSNGGWVGWEYASEADAGKGSLIVSGGSVTVGDTSGMDMYDVTIAGGVVKLAGTAADGDQVGPGTTVRTSPSLGGYNSFQMTGGTVELGTNGRLWSGSAYDGYKDMVFSGGTVNMNGTDADAYITGVVADGDAGNKLLFSGTTVNVIGDGRIDGREIEIDGSTFNVLKDGELRFSATYSTSATNPGTKYESGKLALKNGEINNQGVIVSDVDVTVEGGTLTTVGIVVNNDGATGETEVEDGNFYFNKTLTINGGTVVADTIKTRASTDLTLNSGTLQTASDQVFVLNDGDALIADNADGVKVSLEEGEKLGMNITANGGTLALTDEGVYTNDSLNAMSGALAGSSTTLTFLNSTLAQGEEEATLKDNIVQAQEQVSATVTASEGTTPTLTVNHSGAQSLVVKNEGEGAAAVTEVRLSGNNNSGNTFTLVGASEQTNLVQDTNGNSVDVRVVDGLTLQLGVDEAGAAQTAGQLDKVVIAGGSQMKVNNIEAKIGQLVLNDNDAVVQIGSENNRGDLSVDSLDIGSGSTVFLDPVWQDGAEISDASHLAAVEATITGNLVVGQNSLAAIGVSSTDSAVAAFNKIVSVNPECSWDKNNITAALYLADTLDASTGRVVVDGSLSSVEQFNDASANYGANGVYVAANGMLMVDKDALGSEAAVNGTLTLADGSYIGLVNANEGTIKLTEETSQVVADASKVEVVTDNPFVDAVLGEGAQAGNIVATYDGENGLKALSSLGMQAMTRRADSVLASTIADRTSFGQNLKPGVNLWVDVRGENYQADDFDKGGEFEADMGYGTFGGDVAYGNFTFGAAFQYGTGSLRSSVSKIKNSIDNYGVSLYGTYSVTDAFKLGAELAYIWAENDISSNQTALNQSVDTEMYSAGLRAMYEMKAGDFRFVPSIGVRVSQLSTDEMKVGAVKIDDQDQTLVQIPIAMRITAADFETTSGWTLSPSFKLAYVPTFGDKEIEALHMSEDVIDTSPVQADFGLLAGKDNMLFNVNLLLGAGEYGSSAVGGKVGFKYAF